MHSQVMINAQIVLDDMIALLLGMESLGVDFFAIEQNEEGALTFIPEEKDGMLNISNLINHLTELYEEGYYKAQMVEDWTSGKPILIFHPIVEKARYRPNIEEINLN